MLRSKEISVLGTWLANATFPKAVEIMKSKALNLPFMITHTLPLDGLMEGIEHLRGGDAVEVVIDLRL